MPLIFDADFGWAAVDDAGNYDNELQNEINAAAAASGVDVRDPGMTYRPTLTDTGYSFRPTIKDPTITMDRLAGGNIFNPSGQYSAAEQLMIDIQQVAADQNITLEAPQEPEIQVAGPNIGDPNPNGDGTIWNGTEYVAADLTKEAPLGNPAKDALNLLLEALGGGGVPNSESLNTELRKLIKNFQDGELSQEEVQSFVDLVSKNILAGKGQFYGNDAVAMESDLETIWNLWKPKGITLDAFYKQIGYTSAAASEAAGAELQSQVLKAAAAAPDVNTFISGLLDQTMTSNSSFTWGDSLNKLAAGLYQLRDDPRWADIPGLSGQLQNLDSVEAIKQWLHTSYSQLGEDVRTDLQNRFADRGDNLSSPYETFATAAAAVAGDGSIIAYDNQGKETTVFPQGGKSAEEIAAGMGLSLTAPAMMPTSAADLKTAGEMSGYAGANVPGSSVYDPFATESARRFGDEYPGFARTQPGYRMPAIESAYARAQAPLQTQYGLQLPNLLGPGGTGLDPAYQTPADWLRNLAAGQGKILAGSDLYESLQNVSTALTADPNQLGLDPQGALLRSYFESPGQQAAAYAQPFLMATRGAPEARSALTAAIADAAARFEYQNPAGVMGPGGQRQGFLPWALEQNLLGINQMFDPRTTRAPDPINPLTPTPTASFWGSPEGMKRQEWDLDIQM